MEPERKIEKWLRAYAKKRRAQADASLKMHPATRRLLQSEIVRNKSAPDKDDKTVSVWELVRRQWAFLLGFAICVFLLGLILLPFVIPTKKKALDAAPMLGEASGTIANENITKVPPPPVEQANSPAAVAYSDSASPNTEPADVSPAPAETPAPTAEGASELNDKVNRSAETLAVRPPMQQPSTAVALPAASQTEKEDTLAIAASEPTSYQSQYSYKNSTAYLQKISVLANFQVSQNGNAIRIVDQDGSEYDGSLLPAGTVAESGNANSIPQTDRKQNGAGGGGGFGGADRAPSGSFPAGSSHAAQYYLFRVAGTNYTLNQKVVFSGRLLANVIATKKVQQTLGVTSGLVYGAGAVAGQMKFEVTNQAQPLSWPNLSISGTAIVDNTNAVEVNATPVPHAKE